MVDPAKVARPVDQKVYGHFLEHIYHSCNGGLWGDMVWSRSCEESPPGGSWSIEGDSVVQRGHASLDGKVPHEGMPQGLAASTTAARWQTYGQGQLAVEVGGTALFLRPTSPARRAPPRPARGRGG